MISRRSFLSATIAGAIASAARGAVAGADAKRTIGLGFSLYGMKTLALAEAIDACADLGYDCVELPVMPDWPSDSAKLSADSRRELAARLADKKLRLSALMENLPALGDDAQFAEHQERLKRACELARELKQGEHVPVVETILGGKAGEFDVVKERLVERVREMAKVAAAADVTLAVKAHVSNAIQRPEQLQWLLSQAASPYLKAAYDYSHFQLQELKLPETLDQLLPRTVFIHVKDTEHASGKRGFLLPGEGTIDYTEYFRLLVASKYRGDVVVEVSGQVFGKPGYDPLAAARKCYNHLAAAMKTAGIERD
jgi:sugar phosphate isomerase/epimerase